MVLEVAFATGLLSGFLSVGGDFVRTSAMFSLVRVPVPVAVGTDLFEIVLSSGIGFSLYRMESGVVISVVAPLFAGSALAARIGRDRRRRRD